MSSPAPVVHPLPAVDKLVLAVPMPRVNKTGIVVAMPADDRDYLQNALFELRQQDKAAVLSGLHLRSIQSIEPVKVCPTRRQRRSRS